MIPFHSIFRELAQKEVRCVHIGPSAEPQDGEPSPDEYVFMEFYCEDLECDCRQVFFQVIAKDQAGKVFASINYGWEKEKFYKARWGMDEAREMVRGQLDPENEQSEFAEEFLDIFRNVVLDEPYRLRLRRHYRLLREELARRKSEK